MPPLTPLMFRPPWYIAAFWLLLAGTFYATYFGLLRPDPGIPGWFKVIFFIAPTLALVMAICIVISRARIDDHGVAVRTAVFGWFLPWHDIQRWSQLGEGGSIFVLARSGRIRQIDGGCVHGSAAQAVAARLHAMCGPPATGCDTVCPAWMNHFTRESPVRRTLRHRLGNKTAKPEQANKPPPE